MLIMMASDKLCDPEKFQICDFEIEYLYLKVSIRKDLAFYRLVCNAFQIRMLSRNCGKAACLGSVPNEVRFFYHTTNYIFDLLVSKRTILMTKECSSVIIHFLQITNYSA